MAQLATTTVYGDLTVQRNVHVAGSVSIVSSNALLYLEGTAPVIRLHSEVNNAEGAKIRLTESQWQGGYIHYEANANRLDIGVHPSGNESLSGDVPVISITRDNQRVGIGTTSPAQKLHVAGNVVISSGSLGIGTTSPSYSLHVSGTAYFTNSNFGESLTVHRNHASNAAVITYANNSGALGRAGFATAGFTIYYGTSTDPSWQIDTSGVLAIGTVPWARLSGVPTASTSQAGIVQLNNSVTSTSTTQAATANAVKTAYDTAVAANNNANNRVAKSGDTMTGNLMFSGGTRYIGTSDSNNFVIRTANTDRIAIASNGNVGIGTTSPSYRLHVSGDVGFTGTLQAGTVPWARLSGHPSITINGTSNQINVSGGTQSLSGSRTWTLSLPQNIHTSAAPTFARITLNSAAVPVASPGTGDVVAGNAYTVFQFDASAYTTYISRASDDTTGSYISARKSRGTLSAPAAVSPGDDILLIRGYAYHGTGYGESVRITFDTEGTITQGTRPPGAMRFYTASSSGALTQQMTINSSGYVGIGTASPAQRLHVMGNIRVGNGSQNMPVRYVSNDSTVSYRVVLPVGSNKYATS